MTSLPTTRANASRSAVVMLRSRDLFSVLVKAGSASVMPFSPTLLTALKSIDDS